MKVAMLQFDIAWKKPEENIIRAERLMAEQPGADIYVLPEMFTTGFAIQPEDIADSDGKETVRWMQAKAKELNAAVTGSIGIKNGNQYFNRMFFVTPDEEVVTYDKRHLFAYGGEDKHYTRGEKRVTVTFRGVRFLLEVCFDLRFPVWSRYRDDYDAILYVANWPTCRIDSWDILIRARAIENQCFVVAVNRIGLDKTNDYCGHSAIINPYGQTVAACTDDQECCTAAELNLPEMESYRHKFPIVTDLGEMHLWK